MLNEEAPLVNRVAQSGLITLDLADMLPQEPVVLFDLKPYLVQETVLMEKPFRQALKEVDWNQYQDKIVAVHCSADALIPKWAYMLVASYLGPVCKQMHFGSVEVAENKILLQKIAALDKTEYIDQRVVIKGCGDRDIPGEVYLAISAELLPVVKSLMYGEPCSTVPVYKKPKNQTHE